MRLLAQRMTTAFLLLAAIASIKAFTVVQKFITKAATPLKLSIRNTPNDEIASSDKLKSDIVELKRILEREYTTFFDPMYSEYYSPNVKFTDPMTSLSGVASYQNNVDMLASRTLMGKVLFSEAGIVLHNTTGGEITTDKNGFFEIKDIVTRWTLRLTAKILPWSPTARFSGISIYKVKQDLQTNVGVQIMCQNDYWDSINVRPFSGGEYCKVDTSIAVKDFLSQLQPGGFKAQTAAPEVPYQLLRRGDGYEIRRYPEYAGVRSPYERRDEVFSSLGTFTKGMNPLSPALMDVRTDDINDKFMLWPLSYTLPSDTEPVIPMNAIEKTEKVPWQNMKVLIVPETVVAVREFNDASMEPVVRKADRELRELLKRDGLKTVESKLIRFAQYDAIFSMGKRRGEVWIDLLDGGHPW